MHREVNGLGGDLSDEVRIGVVFFYNPVLATEGLDVQLLRGLQSLYGFDFQSFGKENRLESC